MLEEQSLVYNKNVKILYKDTETRYCNDDEVNEDDLVVMCNLLYQRELLAVFGMEITEEPNFLELTDRMEVLYGMVNTNKQIIEMIQKNFFQDNLTTFFSLFSYDTFHTIHNLICTCL